MDQEQAVAVQNHGAVTLTSVADLVALHSGHVGVTVHVQLKHTWLFLQVYLPAMVLLLHTALNPIRTSHSGTDQDTINLYSC